MQRRMTEAQTFTDWQASQRKMTWHDCTPCVCIYEFASCSGACGGLAVFLLQGQVGSSKPEIHPNVPAPPIQCLTVQYSPTRRNVSLNMRKKSFDSDALAWRVRTICKRSVGTLIPSEQKYRCSSNSRGWLSMSLLMYLERYRASLTGEVPGRGPFTFTWP